MPDPHRVLNAVIKELGTWSAPKDFTVQRWARTIQQNLRRLKRHPNHKDLLEQTAKNVDALRKAINP